MLILPAHAKINLALEVTGRGGRGLHTIDSVLVRIDWHDLVGVAVHSAEGGGGIALAVDGAARGVPVDASNLARRAVAAVLALSQRRASSGARVWLHKRIPAAAGLGGGSADAAAALVATAAALGRLGSPVDEEHLRAAALDLGSDVPALLAGGAQRVRGTGDSLQWLPAPPLHLVVVVAGTSSTAATYAAVVADELRPDGRAASLVALVTRGLPPDDDLLGSALEAAAIRANPDLGHAIEAIRRTWTHQRWHLTGSGGALFAVLPGADAAAALAAEVRAAGYASHACRSVAC